MADNKKIITDELLKLQTEKILQVIADSTYDWQEYTDSEISDILEITDEQAMQLTKILNDQVVANNKLWSSSKTDAEIKNALIESNKYTDDLVANLSNIKLDIVDSLPDSSTVNKSTIYILKDSSGGTNNTLNVWSDTTSAFVEVGKLSVDFTNYYTKSEVDAELAKKANADEVLKPDAIVADLTTTSGSTTLSTAGLQTELDKKANDDEVLKTTDISTTIDGTSTNDTVPTNKAVYDSLLNKVNNTIVLTTADEVNNFDMAYQSFIIEPSVAEAVGLPKAPDSTWFCINLSHFKGFKYPSQIAFEYAGIERIMYRTAHNGVWHNWRKIPTTSVVDVPKTNILSSNSNFTFGSHSCYSVVNGICYVSIWEFKGLTVSQDVAVATGMPKPKQITGTSIINANNSRDNVAFVYVDNSNTLCVNTFIPNVYGYGSFSYPVAES